MTSTRSDICHADGLVSRFESNPGKEHWQAIHQIRRYLQVTKSIKLCFRLSDLELIGYNGANFAGDVNDRQFISGYIFLFGGMNYNRS